MALTDSWSTSCWSVERAGPGPGGCPRCIGLQAQCRCSQPVWCREGVGYQLASSGSRRCWISACISAELIFLRFLELTTWQWVNELFSAVKPTMALWSEKEVLSTLHWETDPLFSLITIKSRMLPRQWVGSWISCVRQLSLNWVCSCLSWDRKYSQSGS